MTFASWSIRPRAGFGKIILTKIPDKASFLTGRTCARNTCNEGANKEIRTGVDHVVWIMWGFYGAAATVNH
uniref:Uncharacterized protein n=1 Tax=Vespula pensylvanica TaxID=30213 RepID=A0A834U8X4_VESPE|nr:hypothetical protein H0235_009847 [Vespula pensylvanica]